MIWFFRDFLDGFTYLGVSILAIIFIMAIIGFMMERKQLERDKKNKEAILGGEQMTSALNPVSISDSTATDNNSAVVTEIEISNNEFQAVNQEEKSENKATNTIPSVLDLDAVENQNNEDILG